MSAYHLEFLGQTALRIVYGNAIAPHLNRRVQAAWQVLQRAALPGVAALVPAYATLTVLLDSEAVLLGSVSVTQLAAQLPRWLAEAGELRFQPRRRELPVRYDGPDLSRVCAHTQLSEAEVIRLHSQGCYDVYFLGFSPGFAYLGGLDARLATPRLPTPRLQVPAGSVAIGGAQTAVYPQATPGGWNLIGSCTLALFVPEAEPPCWLAAGDQVVFVPEAAC